MTGNKYDKYFVKEPLGKRGGFFPVVIANGAEHYEGSEFSFRPEATASMTPAMFRWASSTPWASWRWTTNGAPG